MGDRDWILVGVGVLVALLVVPSYCSDAPSPPGTVLLVGDSLFFQSAVAIDEAVQADGWQAEVWAIPGASLTVGGVPPVDWSPAALGRLVEQWDPEIVVIELGTNGCGPGCPSVPQAVDAIMEPVRAVEVVLWLDVRIEAPTPPDRGEINGALDDATDRWDNLSVLSFDDWFRGQPGLVVEDGVHLTDAGELVVADNVRRSIREHADVD
jgi:hypothetical protein